MSTEDTFDLKPQTVEELQRAKRAERTRLALKGAIAFCLVFMAVEFASGVIAHSLALITDAMHLMTDVATLGLALTASYISHWSKNDRYSYGFARIEVIGATASVFLVWFLAVFIVYEAITRMTTIAKCARHEQVEGCEEIHAKVMVIIGFVGLFVNLGCAGILMLGGHSHSHGGLAGGVHACTGHGHGDHSHSDGEHGNSHEGASSRSTRAQLLRHTEDAERSSSGDVDLYDVGVQHGYNQSPVSSEAATSASFEGRQAPVVQGGGHSHTHDNMHVRGAMIHALGDCVQSVGVIIAAAIIWLGAGSEKTPDSWYNLADPICSLVFAIVTIYTTRWLAVDVFNVLMEASPDGVDIAEVRKDLNALPNVVGIDNLHLWSITPTLKLITAHITTSSHDSHSTVEAATAIANKYGINQSTFQVVPVISDDGAPASATADLEASSGSGLEASFS